MPGAHPRRLPRLCGDDAHQHNVIFERLFESPRGTEPIVHPASSVGAFVWALFESPKDTTVRDFRRIARKEADRLLVLPDSMNPTLRNQVLQAQFLVNLFCKMPVKNLDSTAEGSDLRRKLIVALTPAGAHPRSLNMMLMPDDPVYIEMCHIGNRPFEHSEIPFGIEEVREATEELLAMRGILFTEDLRQRLQIVLCALNTSVGGSNHPENVRIQATRLHAALTTDETTLADTFFGPHGKESLLLVNNDQLRAFYRTYGSRPKAEQALVDAKARAGRGHRFTEPSSTRGLGLPGEISPGEVFDTTGDED